MSLESARDNAATRAKVKKDVENADRATINDYMRSGAAFSEARQPKQALDSLLELENRYFKTGEISKESFRNEWLRLKGLTGGTRAQLSYQAKQDEAITLLKSGIEDFSEALNSTSQDQFFPEKPRLQFGLGLTLVELANRSEQDSISTLKRAVEAFNQSAISGKQMERPDYPGFTVYVPLISLGDAWTKLGEKSNGKESVDYLNQALGAFDRAGKLIKPDHDQFNWANLKSNLGRALENLSYRTSDPQKSKHYLNQAITAYEDEGAAYELLLGSLPLPCSPCVAPMLISLGIARAKLGENTTDQIKGLDYLNKALDAFDKASELIRRDDDRHNWTSLKSSLGHALSALAAKTIDSAKRGDYLKKAVAAYEEAYESDDQHSCLPCAGSILVKLGVARTQLGEQAVDAAQSLAHLNKALDAFDKAEKLIKRDDDQLNRAALKTNLGRALSSLAERASDAQREEFLNRAVTALEEALTIGELNACAPCDASTLLSLAIVRAQLGERESVLARSLEHLGKALKAFDKADKLIKREDDRYAWANLKSNLARALTELATRTSDPVTGEEYLNKAVSSYEDAFAIENQGPCTPCATSTLIGLGIARARLGEKASDPAKSFEHLNNALDTFNKADNLIKRDDDQFGWASLKANLARVFSNLGERTSDPARSEDYFSKAVAAYEDAIVGSNQSACTPCSRSAYIGLGWLELTLGEMVSDPGKSLDYLNKALDAFSKADTLTKRNDDQFGWASLRYNFGRVFSDLADRASDLTTREEYLNKAISFYEEAFAIENQGPCTPCVRSTLIGLGIARGQFGETARDRAKSLDYLNKSIDALDKADKLVARDDLSSAASVKSNLGRTLFALAKRTDDRVKRDEYIKKAVSAYEEGAKHYSTLQKDQGWADSTMGLADAYSLLKNWAAALEATNRVLQAFPDNYRAYETKLGILHGGTFQFEEAFITNKEWLDHYPDDPVAQSDLAESLFTTGRFTESEQSIKALLTNPDVKSYVKTALRAINIGCLLATDRDEEVLAKLDQLIFEVSNEPSDFEVYWIFDGAQHFIGHNEKLSPYRLWMKSLFEALALDHQSMLKALRQVRAISKTENCPIRSLRSLEYLLIRS